ncbi:MAG: hypothetical protein M3487_13190 [Actinomycetota bacterium]|nr:hypothetical protein [Acidimicrobiia bacterium]MDQ3470706.1 hypothetical protein [Actinomycetota bacterium]
MSTDDRLIELLGAIRAGDEADEPMDNELLMARLGWSDDDVAAGLAAAKDRSLIWGMRTGGRPMPHFGDLELTVQGRRFMAAQRASSLPPAPE